MKITELVLPDLLLLSPDIHRDERGYFLEIWNSKRYQEYSIPAPGSHFVQDNESFSVINTVRGLHFQRPPFAQAKLIRVPKGKILDIVLDIRKESPGFGRSLTVELSSDNQGQLYVPVGFAHGFISLEHETIVSYKTTAPYSQHHEDGINVTDPHFNLNLPTDVIISKKDLRLPSWLSYVSNPVF